MYVHIYETSLIWLINPLYLCISLSDVEMIGLND